MSTNLLKRHLTYSSVSSGAKKVKHESRGHMKASHTKSSRNLTNIRYDEDDSNGQIGMYIV